MIPSSSVFKPVLLLPPCLLSSATLQSAFAHSKMADEESQEKPPQPESVTDGDMATPAAPATPPPPPSPSPPPTPPPPEVCRLCGEESGDKVEVFGEEGRSLGLPEKCHNCLPLLVSETPCLFIVTKC